MLAILSVALVLQLNTPSLNLSDIIPQGAIPIETDAPTLVMVGAEKCPATAAFLPFFSKTAPAVFPVRKFLMRTTEMGNLRFLPTPLFVVFINKIPVDIHVGIVGHQNTGAEETNRQIFEALSARNGLSPGKPWSLSNNDFVPRRSYDYQAVKFITSDHRSFIGESFAWTIFTEAVMRGSDFSGATFHNAIMAHVDLSGSKLSDEQARNIIWVNTTCPDGANSSTVKNTCVGHLSAIAEH
jgi:hypothetical protein